MKRRRGQGLVEFALILPVLLLIILGIIEAAFLIQGYITVQHAAREAARFAVTYQPFQGQKLDGTPCDYTTWRGPPFSDPGEVCNRFEDADEYYARRVALIKREARRAAAGLRIDDAHLGDTPSKFALYADRPAFFGIAVWGFPSFQEDCNAYDPWDPGNPCLDHPGLEGLPVQVMVRHNVEIVDPLYSAIVKSVPVRANAQMINEGVQVGFGDVPPPDFDSNPDFEEPPQPPEEPEEPEEPPEEPPGELPTYYIDLNVDHAVNAMPGDRAHEFVATVTDELTQTVQGARVSFSTDKGGFSYSGVDPQYVEEVTDGSGQAAVTLFGTRPETANIRAWLDYDGDTVWNAVEPSDTATKTWTVSGPYITVSKYKAYPEVDSIDINVMDHDPMGNPYRLLWCVISGTTPSAVVQDPVNVDAGGDATDLSYPIPDDCKGLYRMETHTGLGGCGLDELVAYSAPISVVVLPPDLTVARFDVPDLICPETVFTMSVVVKNLSPSSTDQPFDVDFYPDPRYAPPQSPIGKVKQWVSGIGPYEEVVVNTLMWVESPGEHSIWARVDTSDYVDEALYEDNNADVITTTAGSLAGESYDTGWRGPTANYAGARGGLSNPGGAHANNDGSRAYRDDNADGVSHVYRNYGFNIPEDAIIEGIRVRLDWWLGRSRDGNNRIEVYLSPDGGTTWTAARVADNERTRDGNPTDVVGGTSDTWGRTWSLSDFNDDNLRVRLVLRTNESWQDFRVDWVPVQVTYSGQCEEKHERPPWWEGDIKPPGLVECHQLLHFGDFEGNYDRVISYWHAGEPGAYQRQSRYRYDGAYSMRLHASLGSYPACEALSPYLYQTLEIPSEVYTMTTMHVRGKLLVADSESLCCRATTDADDLLYLQVKNGSGADLYESVIANGGVVSKTWGGFEENVTDDVDPYAHREDELQVRFYATHDGDIDCTFFYLDALECEVCTGWPVPDDVVGTASLGGLVEVLVQGIPGTRRGVDVWAYSQGGEVYHTYTIQNGTYHFYNIPPGTYTIYAEYWEAGGMLHYGVRTVTVAENERNYSVDLWLP